MRVYDSVCRLFASSDSFLCSLSYEYMTSQIICAIGYIYHMKEDISNFLTYLTIVAQAIRYIKMGVGTTCCFCCCFFSCSLYVGKLEFVTLGSFIEVTFFLLMGKVSSHTSTIIHKNEAAIFTNTWTNYFVAILSYPTLSHHMHLP